MPGGFDPHSRHFFFAFLILVCGMGGILGVLKMISLKIVKKKLKLAREDNNL